MNRQRCIVYLLSTVFSLSPLSGFSSGDMTAQKPIEVVINLGDKNNKLSFYPAKLQFETGRLYKLVINNPSPQKHYFTAEKMSRAVFTRKVQIIDKTGHTLAEVKGHVDEIEVYPNGIAEWWFVPVKSLTTSNFHCSIKGHTESGMTGSIVIK